MQIRRGSPSDEHCSITVARGVYQVWRQRECTPQRSVTLHD
jgi:hypothetical protein